MRASRQRPRWGQNFLSDPRVARRIVEAAGPAPGETVVEIGPGRGALTRPLLESGAHVVAFEIDGRLAQALRESAAGLPLTVVAGDALKTDLGATLSGAGTRLPVCLVGNLPYESATPMVRAFVRRPDLFSRLVVMVQKEVAERLVARPGTSSYGYLTLDVGAHAEARRLFDVAPGAFSPRPKVTSAVVELTLRAARAGTEPALAVASAAFTARRKPLLDGLAPRWGGEAVAAVLERLALPPLTRAEELPLSRFHDLAEALGPSPPRSRARFSRGAPATIH
ncbi:MAG TPA: 16S rRNA (adenine(1518)-N(6)/adenine(1519)-N(6))-dimethyltransferase RsmA [Thermoanaerobaculia bacterium]|nr:16S rRNA (adenine(1518)-N(6)/adenine(1519)-N(6))-dimethyltransferase RsmA [Thermoanaerobaculia bacterium]